MSGGLEVTTAQVRKLADEQGQIADQITAGKAATLFITPQVDNVPEGDETVVLTLNSSANYNLGSLSNAIVPSLAMS